MEMGRRAKQILAIAILAFLATAGAAYFLNQKAVGLDRRLASNEAQFTQELANLRAQVAKLEADVRLDDLFQGLKESVDLTKTNFQALGDEGFSIAISGVSTHLSGIKVVGRILNEQSVTHEQAKFKIEIGGQSNDFYVRRISPGRAAQFSVYLPNVKVKDAGRARFRYVESTLSYFNQ